VRCGVIGAGALGLTVARRMAERGHDVTVLERDPVPGGLGGSFEVAPGIWLENYYHHLLRTCSRSIRGRLFDLSGQIVIGTCLAPSLGPRTFWRWPDDEPANHTRGT
jgi:protoporphyrinogen oxidase